MPQFGTANAPHQSLVGPLLSHAGFQYWYLVCTQDCIVVVRQGFFSGFFASHAGLVLPRRMNVYAYYLMTFLRNTGLKRRRRIEAELNRIPTSSLHAKPNRVFPTSELRSITLVTHAGSLLVQPDILLETLQRKKRKFGIQRYDFDQASAQLQQMYPALCVIR